jgi:hypothetical protein
MGSNGLNESFEEHKSITTLVKFKNCLPMILIVNLLKRACPPLGILHVSSDASLVVGMTDSRSKPLNGFFYYFPEIIFIFWKVEMRVQVVSFMRCENI